MQRHPLRAKEASFNRRPPPRAPCRSSTCLRILSASSIISIDQADRLLVRVLLAERHDASAAGSFRRAWTGRHTGCRLRAARCWRRSCSPGPNRRPARWSMLLKPSAGFMSLASFSHDATPMPAVVKGSALAGRVKWSRQATSAGSLKRLPLTARMQAPLCLICRKYALQIARSADACRIVAGTIHGAAGFSFSRDAQQWRSNHDHGKTGETVSLIGSDKVQARRFTAPTKKIGSFERVMIEKISGKVSYAVISFGGFLGIGEDISAALASSNTTSSRRLSNGITEISSRARRNTATTTPGTGATRHGRDQ